MTLTEQWKKGELEKHRRYYVRTGEKIFTSYLDEHNCFLQSREEDTYQEYEEYTTYCDEVLAPVPSYEEYLRTKYSLDDYKRLCDMRGKIIDKMDESNEDTVKHLRQENAQLRKFLEEFNALDVAKENQQLKELLKECQQSFRGIRVQIEEFEYSMARKTAQIAIDEIDNAIGEKK